MILRTQHLAVLGALASLLLPLTSARFQNDFSDYPKDSISCLEEADAQSGCNGDTVPEMNTCLCGDGGGFITNSAKCIGEKSLDDLETAYAVFKINCDNSNTPMDINLAAFLDLAKASEKTTTSDGGSVTSTSGPDPTNTSADEGGGGGLSTGAMIGIGVGGGVVVLAVLGVAIFVFLRKRKQRSVEESHPMLVNQSYGGAFPPGLSPSPGHGHMPELGVYHSPNDVKAEHTNPASPVWRPSTQSPGLTPHAQGQQQGWDSRHTSWNSQQGGWNGHQSWVSATQPYQALGGQTEQAPQAPQLFELANTQSQVPQNPGPPAVEMPGSQPGQPGPGYGGGRY